MTISVLMVAEKPSICTSIAHALCKGQKLETRGKSPPIHEFNHSFLGKPAFFRVTSVTGHVFSTDFPAKYQSWDTVDPLDLFSAPVVHSPEGKGGIVKHLEREAKGMDYLVLWLDCDREGENICFEVIQCVKQSMKQPQQQTSSQGNKDQYQNIFRAKFSAVTPKDIEKAMNSLVKPNENESKAVDARQELDLKVGVAFSRFQTQYFQGKYGNLDSAIISYGPCQTPTLGFCVDRYDEIQSFKSKPYYCIDLSLEVRGRIIALTCDRGRISEKSSCDMLMQLLGHDKELICKEIKSKDTKRSRPQPLNTVELLKLASKNLGIGPQATMRAAEHLYLSGYLSYPRTESTAYPSSFDFKDVLHCQKAHPEWGSYSNTLLTKGYTPAKHGHDAGDHPPITPVGLALPHELSSSDNVRIYELVVRHFLATISPDAVFLSTKAKFFGISSKETFTIRGKREISPGFLQIYRSSLGFGSSSATSQKQDMNDEDDNEEEDEGNLLELPDLEKDKAYRVASVKPRQGNTTAPGYLTESDLISKMEKHGIGTDASIPTHINNITIRNYVTLGQGRTLIPTELGIVLVHGYQRIDPYLVLPDTRAAIEQSCDKIAKGIASKEQILSQALTAFKSKFEYFRTHIGAMDSLFEATFSPLAMTGKNMGKCGRCNRYMRYIPLKPQRLHCPTCKETYSLPQKGTIKLYKELKCPLDQFELVLFSLGNSEKAQGKSYPLCPFCYNYPPQFISPSTTNTNTTANEDILTTSSSNNIVSSNSNNVSSSSNSNNKTIKADVDHITSNLNDLTVVSNMRHQDINNNNNISMIDIEDHNGVKIKRRIKEAIHVNTSNAQSTDKNTSSSTATNKIDEEVDEYGSALHNMGCNSCMHPTCKQSATINGLCKCPGGDKNGNQCNGTLVLDVNSKPNWKLACNICNTLIIFRSEIHNITPQPHIPCPECGIHTTIFEFNKLKTPLPNGKTTHIGCIICDDFLNNLTEVKLGRSVNLQVIRQERHRRSNSGRGRSNRGRGRSGGRGRGDIKMSFSDF